MSVLIAKRFYLIMGAVGMAIAVTSLFLISLQRPAKNTSTPSLESTNKNQALKLIETFPANNSTNIPQNQEITFVFNKNISLPEPKITIKPEVSYKYEVKKETLLIKPEILSEGLRYVVTVTLENQTFFTTFTTIGKNTDLLPNTGDVDTPEDLNENLLVIRPDIFVSNYVPYAQAEFFVSSKFKNNKFIFIVEPRAQKEIAQEAFSNWLKSIGLKDSQINSLTIEYK